MSDEKLYYRVRVWKRLQALGKTYLAYRHEIDQVSNHLTLFLNDGSVLSIPVAGRSWLLYPEYWPVQETYKRIRMAAEPPM